MVGWGAYVCTPASGFPCAHGYHRIVLNEPRNFATRLPLESLGPRAFSNDGAVFYLLSTSGSLLRMSNPSACTGISSLLKLTEVEVTGDEDEASLVHSLDLTFLGLGDKDFRGGRGGCPSGRFCPFSTEL